MSKQPARVHKAKQRIRARMLNRGMESESAALRIALEEAITVYEEGYNEGYTAALTVMEIEEWKNGNKTTKS